MANLPSLPGMPSASTPSARPRMSSAASVHPLHPSNQAQPPSHPQVLRHTGHHRTSSSAAHGPTASSSSSTSSRHRPSSHPIPQAPTIIPRNAIVHVRSNQLGKYTITIGEGAVIHPHARILAYAGDVVIGRGAIVEERATVGYSSVNAAMAAYKMSQKSKSKTMPGAAGMETPGSTPAEGNAGLNPSQKFNVVIGDCVTIGPGAIVEAEQIGEMTVVDGAAIVGPGSVVGKFCKVGPSLTVLPYSSINDFTILYSAGVGPAVPLSALLPQHHQPKIPDRPPLSAVSFSFPPDTPVHTPTQSVSLNHGTLQTPLQTPTKHRPGPATVGGQLGISQTGTVVSRPGPPPRKRTDVSSRDNEIVRQQRRAVHDRHLGVLMKLLLGAAKPPTATTTTTTTMAPAPAAGSGPASAAPAEGAAMAASSPAVSPAAGSRGVAAAGATASAVPSQSPTQPTTTATTAATTTQPPDPAPTTPLPGIPRS